MIFPKYFNVLVNPNYAQKVSKNGEVMEYSIVPERLRIIHLLSRALGFSYKVYTSPSRKFGTFMGETVMNEESMRYSTHPTGTGCMTFAALKPNFAPSHPLSFLKPFDLSTWIGLLFTLLLVSCPLRLVYRGRIPLVPALFHVSAAFLAQHRDWRPPDQQPRSWWSYFGGVGVTLLTLSYGSLLFSSLSVPVREKEITDFSELYEAILKGKASAFSGDGEAIMFLNSDDEKMIFTGEHLKRRNNQTEYMENFNGLYLKPNLAYNGKRRELAALLREDTHFISKDFFSLNLETIYVIPECDICMVKLNEIIHWIWATGLIKKIYDDRIFKETLVIASLDGKINKAVEDAVKPINLFSLSGAFYLLIFGLLLSTVCFLCELYIFRCTARSRVIFY